MSDILIEEIKNEITRNLKHKLSLQGICVHFAANDAAPLELPSVMFEGIEDVRLDGKLLRWEIRVILGVLGRATHTAGLVEAVYYALVSYKPTAKQIASLLMSMHIEPMTAPETHIAKHRATAHYRLGQY